MKRSLLCLLLLGSSAALAADGFEIQIERGRQLFLHSSKGTACSTCHALEGHGNAIGPDLTRLAKVAGPRGLVLTIEMTVTAFVQQISLRNGRTFPGIQKQKEGDVLKIYDLSTTPAVLLQLKSAEVASMNSNSKWSHPPMSAGYTSEELADIISYLKFVSTGVAKAVTVSELR